MLRMATTLVRPRPHDEAAERWGRKVMGHCSIGIVVDHRRHHTEIPREITCTGGKKRAITDMAENGEALPARQLPATGGERRGGKGVSANTFAWEPIVDCQALDAEGIGKS